MKGNEHLVIWNTVTVLFTGTKHIHFVANKMDGYLQFSTKPTAKAILSSIF